jgi:hypothetical protein
MWRVRVYLPTTLSALAARWGSPLSEPGAIAYAVTPALREWYREGDLEELEYVALSHAALASLRLIAREPAAEASRRVVLAADVPDGAVNAAPDLDHAAVRLAVPVTVELLAAAHVDDLAAAPEVARAAQVVDRADGGDDDAQFVVGGLDDYELQWYAVQEIEFLLAPES